MKGFILLILPFWLSATRFATLIENAKNTHISLEAIEQKISALDNAYEASKNFANPELSLSIGDIQFKDPVNRSIEPMQYSSVSIKQKIPYFGKRDAAGNKVNAQKQKVILSLQEAKVKLIQALKITAYSIWKSEEEIKITDEYMKLTHQTIDIYTAYSSSDSSYNMGIISAQLKLSELKIKKHKLESVREGLYKKISYLSAMDVYSVELLMEMSEPKNIAYYLDASNENSSYKVKEAITHEANAELKIKELAAYVDTSVQVGYYRRESFEDYMSIGVSFSLPIYGTEKLQEEAAQKLLLSSKSEAVDFKNLLSADIADAYAKLQYAYKEYTIIHNDSLPQLNHMFELTSSSIQSGSDLFIYLELLQKKLVLDEQSIESVSTYYKTLASLEALTGEM